jgi:cellulose synthase/poly-beta-1,6-N-acetylglucosamine synthase-like glycosyltransferase
MEVPALMEVLGVLSMAALGLGSLVWVLPLASDLLSVLKVRTISPRTCGGRLQSPIQRLLFVVPAHDEEHQIVSCVRSILDLDCDGFTQELAVVADNCSDATAVKARSEGASVYERHDRAQPGKPKAIQWLLDQVDLGSFDAVVIIDADTVVSRDYGSRLVASGQLSERAVQTYYDLQNAGDSWVTRLASVLVQSRYEGQYALRAAAGLNAPLTGNGMCLGTGLLERCGWAEDSLTENWEMYVRYSLAGERIDLVPEARLASLEPDTVRASSIRRSRWQAGKWHVLRHHVGRIVSSARISRHQQLDILAEMLSPGPVIHAGVGFTLGLLLLFWSRNGLVLATSVLFLLSPLPTVFWTVRAVIKRPDRHRVVADFVRLPFYLVWRVSILGLAVPTYLRGAWMRSPRTGDS